MLAHDKNIKGQHEAVRIRKAVRPAGRNQLICIREWCNFCCFHKLLINCKAISCEGSWNLPNQGTVIAKRQISYEKLAARKTCWYNAQRRQRFPLLQFLYTKKRTCYHLSMERVNCFLQSICVHYTVPSDNSNVHASFKGDCYEYVIN